MYPYITSNNLEIRQHYMYSEYHGLEFLHHYTRLRSEWISTVKSRIQNRYVDLLEHGGHKWGACIYRLNGLLDDCEELKWLDPVSNGVTDTDKYEEKELYPVIYLSNLLAHLIQIVITDDSYHKNELFMLIMNQLTKTFEVRKRLYTAYSQDFKPISENYQPIGNYVEFSFLLNCVYLVTENYKYLNTIIKINDTISSIYKLTDNDLNNDVLFYCSLVAEMHAIQKLISHKGLAI